MNPNLEPTESSVKGIVTLIWPYASSKKTFSLLLVEPDFRLRSDRGQVRVHFQGPSAKAVARSGISSGDQLLLSLKGAQWAKDSTAAATPGRGIGWELQFEERLVLQVRQLQSVTESSLNVLYQVQRPSQQPIPLDIDHPTPSPEPSVQTPTPAWSQPHNNHFATSIGGPQLNAPVWASPAFLKRSHFLATDYDPFAEEGFPDNDRRKRTKFGRGSGQWRFAERTPSPEKESESLPLDIASPSRLPAQDRPRGKEVQSLVQQAHGTGSPSIASDVAANALTNRSELKVQSGYGSTIKDTSTIEGKEPPTSLSQVNSNRHMIQEVTKDENIGNNAIMMTRAPYTKTNPNDFEVLEERGQVDSSITRPMSSTFETGYVDHQAFQETAQSPQVLPPAPIGRPSPASSSSAPESGQEFDENPDHESDDASYQECDSLFDEQSESGRSNAAMYSAPTSDFGLDGSTFSRPPPPAEFAPPPSVIKRLEEGLEVGSLNTDDARDISSSLQNDIEHIESENEEPSISKDSAAEILIGGDRGPREDIDVLEGQDAAQRRSSIQLPSPDQLGNPEAEDFDDKAMEDPAAAQLLTDDGGSTKDVNILQDESAVQRSFNNLPSSPNQVESEQSPAELVLRSREVPDDEAALEFIPEKSPACFPKEQSPSSSREKEVLSQASDEEDALDTSPEKGLADSAVGKEPPITRQQKLVPVATLSQEELKIFLARGQGVGDLAENVGILTSKIQQRTVEIVDLESGDEDDIGPQTVGQEGFQTLVNKNVSEFTPTNEVSAHESPLQSVPDARYEHQASMDEAYRLSTLPDHTGLVLKPVTAVEEFPFVDIHVEPEAHQATFERGEESPHKQSPVAIYEGYEEKLPSIEATSNGSQEARLKSKERELPPEEEPHLKQARRVQTELEPPPVYDLPSIVPDSFEDITSKSQLLTPSSTQQTNLMSQPSSVSTHLAPEDDTLPTPRLTQGTSAGIVPPEPLAPPEEPTLTETPAPPKKTSALIERLKEMRRLSNQSPKPRSSDASVLDPWFAPNRLSQVVRDSEDESEAESSPEREAPAEIPKIFSRQLTKTPEEPLAKSFIRSPQRNHISSIESSPPYHPSCQPPPPGFRTKLSYFVPLATLPSHFATIVDVLAIALSSTPITRATSGPRDYNQILYITDPSSSTLQNSITTAQIFRPNDRCFPLAEKGDALLLRDFKVQPFQKRLSLLSKESSGWAVFRKGADVQIRGRPVEFGAEERGFARGLWDWWASLGDDARKQFENAVPEYKKPNGTAKTTKSKAGGNRSGEPIKKEEIEGLGVNLPGLGTKEREWMKERSLDLDGVEEEDMVHESIEAPRRILRARGAKGANGRSESARESRFGTVFTGGLGEPDETQGSAHELRDGKAYRDQR